MKKTSLKVILIALIFTIMVCMSNIVFASQIQPRTIEPRTEEQEDKDSITSAFAQGFSDGLKQSEDIDLDDIDSDNIIKFLEKAQGLETIIPKDLLEKFRQELKTNTLSEETTQEVLTQIEQNATNQNVIDIIDQNNSLLLDLGATQSDIKVAKKLLESNVIDISTLSKKLAQTIEDVKNGADVTDAILNNFVYGNDSFITIIGIIIAYFFIVFFAVLFTALIIGYILDCIALWQIFKKAGQKPWKALIPFYRQVIYLEVCKFNPWVYAIAFIPFVGVSIYSIVKILSYMRFSELFGHGLGYALGLAFFPHIFELIIAFDGSVYDNKEEKKPDELANFNTADFK